MPLAIRVREPSPYGIVALVTSGRLSSAAALDVATQ